MYERPESYEGPRVTSRDDDRITVVGRWLRSTKINELPQLWNVLIGDMSLVGPRPEDPEIMESWPQEVRDEILSVRPGLTSPASVLYHSEEDLLSKADLMGLYIKDILPDKSRLDQLYVRNRSFASDLDLIFWTTAIFIPRIARAKIPEGYLFAGPFSRLVHRHASWFVVDLLTALIAVALTTLSWRSLHPLNWGSDNLIVLAFTLAFLFSGVNTAIGTNRIVWSQAVAEDAVGLVLSSSFVTLLLLLLNALLPLGRLLPLPPLPTPMIITLGLLAQVGFIATRYRLRFVSGLAARWLRFGRTVPGVGERVLIVGDGEASQIAHWLLNRGLLHHIFSVVGLVATEDPTRHGMRLHGCWVLGGIGDLSTLVKEHDVRMIIYAVSSSDSHTRDVIFDLCKASKIRLVFLDDLLGLIDRHLHEPATSSDYLRWLQKRAESMETHDALTGLPNACLLEERLRHSILYAKRYKTRPAIVFIGLNGLQRLTATDGPRTEDELLKIVARRLATIKRESDTLARFKKQEFALLLENVPDEGAAESVMRRLITLVSEPIPLKEKHLSIGAGITLYLPSQNLEELSVLRDCDFGLYYAGWRKQADITFEHVAELRRDVAYPPGP
jgi:diguanylate cyclase (GGDEF)-like protein